MAIKAMKEIIPIFKSEFERFDKKIDFSLLSEKQLYDLFIRKLTDISMSYSDRKFWIDYDENNDRFIIKVRVFDDYPGNTLYAVSISVLPDLHAINKPFHDFICMVLSIMSSRDVPLIDSNYYGEWELDTLSEIIEEGDSTFELEREMKLYRKWHMKYRQLLSSNFFNHNKAIKLLEKSSLPSELHDSALNWMLKTEKMDDIDWDLDTISSTARHA
ncbi:MAG: hypothetical protein GX567_11915 [Clostridia bacterium]|nr:hypothetical protein [Clostridia bacterium]